jgi:general stress protein CsbA
LLVLAKTSGVILFGNTNAFVPVVMAAFLIDLSSIAWGLFIPAVLLIAVASTFLGLFTAVALSEVLGRFKRRKDRLSAFFLILADKVSRIRTRKTEKHH